MALLGTVLLAAPKVQAQTTIFFERMGTVTETTSIASHEASDGFDNDHLTMTDGGADNPADIRRTNNIGTDGTDDANVFFSGAEGEYGFAIEGINASSFSDLSLRFFYRKESNSALPEFALQYWDGHSYQPVSFSFEEAPDAPTGWYEVADIALPPAAQFDGLRLRWLKSGSISVRLDEVRLEGVSDGAPPPSGDPVVLAEWNFADEDLVADGGIPANAEAVLGIEPDRSISFPQGSGGAGTSSASATGWHEGGGYWYTVVSTEGYEDISVSSKQFGSNTGPRDFRLEYRTSDAEVWSAVPGGAITVANNWTSGVLEDLPLPPSAGGQSTLHVRWLNTSTEAIGDGATGSSGSNRIDDIVIRGVLMDEAPPPPPAEGAVFVSHAADVAAAALVLPNDTWGIHAPGDPFEFAENDWRYDGTQITYYIVAADGTSFFSASITVEWDAEVLSLVSGTAADVAADGIFSSNSNVQTQTFGADDLIQIDAARLDNQNVVIDNSGGDQYLARLTFELLRPGHTAVELTALDFRATDGDGGQSVTEVEGHDGALRAFLGDVASGLGGGTDESSGDGLVDFDDLILFAAAYWAGVPGGPDEEGENYKIKYDVGPTADGTVFTLPQLDGQIQFEDLVIFSLSYGLSINDLYPRPASQAEPSTVIVAVAPARGRGDELHVPVVLSDVADLRAIAVEFAIDTAAFEVLGAVPADGGMIPSGAPSFTAAFAANGAGMADAARLGGDGLTGSGELFAIRVRPLSGDVAGFEGSTSVMALHAATARNSLNQDFPTEIGAPARFDGDASPLEFALDANYPNPVGGSTTIAFELPETVHVRLHVYDALGRQVAVLVDEELVPGRHRVELNADALASGTYLYRIEAGSFVSTRRITVIR